VNSRSDPLLHFDPEPGLQGLRTRPTWYPVALAATQALEHSRWRTRAARGFSWNRLGRALPRGVSR